MRKHIKTLGDFIFENVYQKNKREEEKMYRRILRSGFKVEGDYEHDGVLTLKCKNGAMVIAHQENRTIYHLNHNEVSIFDFDFGYDSEGWDNNENFILRSVKPIGLQPMGYKRPTR